MAATRLIPLHENKGKTVSKCLKDRVDYAKNGEKTENGELVSAYECNPEIVDREFYAARNEYLKDHRVPGRDVIAYQIRQSFKPGEITAEEANEIGYELAQRFTKGRHAFIVATHTDKAHIHNHIIFNSVDLSNMRKFKNFFLSSFVIQKISDRLCLEHGLSVIKPKPYSERQRRTDYPSRTSNRDVIRVAIDRALARNPRDMEEFLRLMEEEGYQIRRNGSPAIRRNEQQRYIRFRSLGEGYRYEDLERIIAGDQRQEGGDRARTTEARPEKRVDLLIDIQAKMAQGKGAGYERWAKVYNVKQVAKALLLLDENNIRDLDALSARAKESEDRFKEISGTIKAAEKRMAEIATLKSHILNYSKTREVYVAYRKAGYSKRFFEAHRDEIMTHKAAKKAFAELNVEKLPTIKQLNEEFARLLAQKKEAYREYRQAKQDMTDFATAKYDIERFLNVTNEQEQQNRQIEDRQRNSEQII